MACALVLAVSAALPLGQRGPLQVLLIGLIAGLASFALTVLFVRSDGLKLRDVGAEPGRHSLGHFATGFAFGLMLLGLHTFLVGILGHVRWEQAARPTIGHATLVMAGYLLLAAREELSFHGYPLRRLQGPFGAWGAQACIAAAFAFEHMLGGWSPGQAVWGAAMGSLLFGMASIATRGLAVPIGIHAAWNIGDWLRGFKPEPGAWRATIESGFERTATLAGIGSYVAVMVLGTCVFWWWHRSRTASEATGS